MTDAQTLNMIFGGKKIKKARKPRAKSIKIGASVEMFSTGQTAIITSKDERYKNAWFIEVDGVASPYSFSRDMFKVL